MKCALIVFAAALALAAPADAQLLPIPAPDLPPPGLSRTIEPVLGEVQRTAGAAQSLAEQRVARVVDLVRRNRRLLDVDPGGNAVVRGEVLTLDPSDASLAIARQSGFAIAADRRLEAIGVRLVTLTAPAGWSTLEAVRRLRRLDPSGDYDFDPLYAPSGEGAQPAGAPAAEAAPSAARVAIGLVDAGIALDHPAFVGARIAARSFAAGATPSDHGTATASLLVGVAGRLHPSARGARLMAADVYGARSTGGSAAVIATALDWLAGAHVAVIDINLVGPANRIVEAAVAAVERRGMLLVAPVGNDGPAAPPAYPASYPGVIAVTAVDSHGRPLPEAGRARHTDFAALGAGVTAATAAGGYARMRGTSFAAPVVAGELAERMAEASPAAAQQAVSRLAERSRGAGPALGHGIVPEP